jgi:hypothetical protein
MVAADHYCSKELQCQLEVQFPCAGSDFRRPIEGRSPANRKEVPLCDVIAVCYRNALFVDGLYGSACKETVPFNGSNSGSL